MGMMKSRLKSLLRGECSGLDGVQRCSSAFGKPQKHPFTNLLSSAPIIIAFRSSLLMLLLVLRMYCVCPTLPHPAPTHSAPVLGKGR